jgi:predicted secreted Zn-dependent protease
VAILGFPKQLSLNDFKGADTAPPSTNARKGYQLRAETSSTVKYDIQYVSEVKTVDGEKVTKWKVKRNFMPSLVLNKVETWMLNSVKNDKAQAAETLAHEQGHYDISGLCAREFQRQMLALETDTEDELKTQMQGLITAMTTKIDSLNAQYDNETCIKGTLQEQQLRQTVWLQAIATCKNNAECDFSAPN